MIDWVQAHEALFLFLLTGSIVMFVATLAIVPVLLLRLPADYFSHARRQRPHLSTRHPVIRALLLTLKNLLGVVLIAGGVAMLVLPGQGIITILIGITLMNFPGKYRLERWLIERPLVLRGINWLRRRYDVPPLRID
jgi:hypothetical protein